MSSNLNAEVKRCARLLCHLPWSLSLDKHSFYIYVIVISFFLFFYQVFLISFLFLYFLYLFLLGFYIFFETGCLCFETLSGFKLASSSLPQPPKYQNLYRSSWCHIPVSLYYLLFFFFTFLLLVCVLFLALKKSLAMVGACLPLPTLLETIAGFEHAPLSCIKQ